MEELKTSRAAMAAFDATRPTLAAKKPGTRTSDEARAEVLVESLLNVRPFDTGKNWLLAAHRHPADPKLESADRRKAADVIAKVCRLLIPWLYIVGSGLPLDRRLERRELGQVILLPAGLETFAEIVMAGIDGRTVQYQAITDPDGWPKPQRALTVQPDSGTNDITDENLRKDLASKLPLPPEAARKGDKEKDESINGAIKYLFEKRNIRTYWICDNFRDNQSNIIEIVAKRYPMLGVLELDEKLFIPHQELFNEIRHLFDLVES